MSQKRFSSSLRQRLTVIALAVALLPAASAQSNFKVLYNFKGGADGVGPSDATLSIDPKGEISGTTVGGGTGKCGGGCGTAFRLTARGNGHWAKTIVHNFQEGDGYFPFGGVSSTRLGTCTVRPVSAAPITMARSLSLPRNAGGKSTETILYNFGTNDIGAPRAALLLDEAGDFFSTAGDPYELSLKAGGRGGGGASTCCTGSTRIPARTAPTAPDRMCH